ncbi:MAG: antitoxin HicB [Clostridiales bacterium]|nr:antitoxin HicB [Clostridiales bacterium]
MNNTLNYKGYLGSIEFSEQDGVFSGKVLGIRALISYEGASADELIKDFHDAIDDYLDLCKGNGTEPEYKSEPLCRNCHPQ